MNAFLAPDYPNIFDAICNDRLPSLERQRVLTQALLEQGQITDPYVASFEAWGMLFDEALEKIS